MRLDEIEKLVQDDDPRILPALVKEQLAFEQAARLRQQVDMAETFQHAYVGARKGRGSENQVNYNRWLRHKIFELEKLLGKKRETIWGSLRRARKL